MSKQNNKNRKKQKTRKKISPATTAKTIITAFVLGALCAFGFWRCVDETDRSPLDPYKAQPRVTKRNVDMGMESKPDPTIVNEDKLLESEMPDMAESKEEGAATAPKEPTQEERKQQEDRFKMHAVAYHFHTQIRSGPSNDDRVVGYARRGATFKVSERISRDGCPKGWYEISPGGLFACSSNGILVSDKPVTFAPSPRPPDMEAPLPYPYEYVSENNTPQFWRPPTPEESVQVRDLFARLEKRDSAPVSEEILDKQGLADVLSRATGADGGVEAPGAIGPSVEKIVLADGGVLDPYALPPFVHLRMSKGYFVSTDDDVTADDKTYRRTIRGRFLPAGKLVKSKPGSFEGVLLGSETTLPFVIVVGGGVKLLSQTEPGGAFNTTKTQVERFSRLPYVGETTRKGRRYVQVGPDRFISDRVAAVFQAVQPPADVKPAERWIDINLSEQTLVAYEENKPVFATIVSTGRKDFETPEGEFRIYSKHVTITMDDPEGGEEAYSIEDVPWTQYFQDSYALHGAFWHDRFGRVRSHGCVNLSPADARRLFFWTGPHLPSGLHGIASTHENPGTRVVIHK